MQNSHTITISRGHIFAVLIANLLLWTSVMLLAPQANLGGVALVGIISIATLVLHRRN